MYIYIYDLYPRLGTEMGREDFEKQVLASPPEVLVPEEYDEVLRGEFARHCAYGERLNTELMHSGKWATGPRGSCRTRVSSPF